MMTAVLDSPLHPEYGGITVPFPIPREEYDHTMELLENLGIGDALRQDCRIVEVNSKYPVLERMAGSEVNVDELDYLAKRLESFCASEDEQFQAMGHKLGLTDIKDFINLTFCCQESTVISDFSKLEQAGKHHAMNLNGGTLPMEDLEALDGYETALRLIDTGAGVVTPYGVVYDNGMKLEPLYHGCQFPPYCYDDSPLTVCLTPTQDGEPVSLDLPASDRQLGRSLLRAGIANLRDTELSVEIDNLPQKISDRLHLEREGLDDLNEMCRVTQPLSQAQREKLEAVVCAVQPEYASEVRRLAEELEQFDFIPNIRTAEEFGQYMIRESGHFEYDENLEGFYDYRLYGEQRIREEGGLFTARGYVAYHGTIPLEELMQDDPAEQYQQEQGPQMGGQSF